ncbi:MAG: Sec-independent protein translocase protein TatB [Croceibacterium sp.]
MFDISWGKLVVIGVIALIVIGPKELPAVLRTVGQWMGKMRRMAAEFQGQFQDAMREAEMADLKKTFDETTSGLSSVFDPIKNDIDKMVGDPMSTGSSSTASAATPDAGIPTPEPSVPADPVALGTAPVAPPPEVSVPMPEVPPPVDTKDFAAPITPAPATPAPDPAQASPSAGAASSAGAAPASAPEAGGGKAA